MLAGILGFVFGSLQVIGPAVSQEAPEYVGTFQGTKWYISEYKGGSPGPGFLHLMLLNLRRQGSMVHYLLSAVKNNIPSTSRRTDRSRPTKALHGNFLEGIVKSVLAMSPLGRVHPDIIKIIR